MKTINGNNKTERKINKAQKYLGIELQNKSNQYLQIKSWDANKNYFVVFGKVSKNGEWLIVDPENNRKNKPYFFKVFGALELSDYFDGGQWVVRPFKDCDIEDFEKLSAGFEDVTKLDDYMKINNLRGQVSK